MPIKKCSSLPCCYKGKYCLQVYLNFTKKQLEMHFIITELVLMRSYGYYYLGHHCNLVAPLTTAIFYQRDNFVFKCYYSILNRLEGSISKAMSIARIEAFSVL